MSNARTQKLLSERTWEFKSPRPHQYNQSFIPQRFGHVGELTGCCPFPLPRCAPGPAICSFRILDLSTVWLLANDGHAEALRRNGIEGISEIPILPKPFKAAELSRRIAEILK